MWVAMCIGMRVDTVYIQFSRYVHGHVYIYVCAPSDLSSLGHPLLVLPNVVSDVEQVPIALRLDVVPHGILRGHGAKRSRDCRRAHQARF